MKAWFRLLRRKNVYSLCNGTSRYYMGRSGNSYRSNKKPLNYCNKTVRSSYCSDSQWCNRLSEKTYRSIYDTVHGYSRVGFNVKYCIWARLKRSCGNSWLSNPMSPFKNNYFTKRRSYQVNPQYRSSNALCLPSLNLSVTEFIAYKRYLYGHKVILSGERCLQNRFRESPKSHLLT